MEKVDLMHICLILHPEKKEKIQYSVFSKTMESYKILQYIRSQRKPQ